MTCSSRQTEEIAAQQKRRQERQNRVPSEGYPGLAFGSGFSSNTMMRLRIIANELHNISSVQLKRAEGKFPTNIHCATIRKKLHHRTMIDSNQITKVFNLNNDIITSIYHNTTTEKWIPVEIEWSVRLEKCPLLTFGKGVMKRWKRMSGSIGHTSMETHPNESGEKREKFDLELQNCDMLETKPKIHWLF